MNESKSSQSSPLPFDFRILEVPHDLVRRFQQSPTDAPTRQRAPTGAGTTTRRWPTRCAAASNAILDRLTAPGFVESVETKGAQLERGLRKIARKHKDKIVEVRGRGLMQGVEFRSDASAVVKGLREKGILTIKAGEKVLRLLPPLVIKPAEIREFLTALEAVVAALPAEAAK